MRLLRTHKDNYLRRVENEFPSNLNKEETEVKSILTDLFLSRIPLHLKSQAVTEARSGTQYLQSRPAQVSWVNRKNPTLGYYNDFGKTWGFSFGIPGKAQSNFDNRPNQYHVYLFPDKVKPDN